MAKRYFDTGIIEQSWYQKLSPKGKALYIHLLCICDYSGVFEVNTQLISMYIGEPITEDDIFGMFGKRVIPLLSHENKGIITDFVYFQQGGVINPKSTVHKGILTSLKKNGISIEELCSMCTHKLIIKEDGAAETKKSIPHPKPAICKSAKEDDEYIKSAFDKFWVEYPRRDAKQGAFKKFVILMKECKSHEDMDALLNKMLKAVDAAKTTPQWNRDNGQYIPMAQTWLNQHRWEDEGVVESPTGNQKKINALAASFRKAMTF